MMLIAAIPSSWKVRNNHASYQIVEDNLTLVQNYMSDTWSNVKLLYNFLTARLEISIEKHQQRWP